MESEQKQSQIEFPHYKGTPEVGIDRSPEPGFGEINGTSLAEIRSDAVKSVLERIGPTNSVEIPEITPVFLGLRRAVIYRRLARAEEKLQSSADDLAVMERAAIGVRARNKYFGQSHLDKQEPLRPATRGQLRKIKKLETKQDKNMVAVGKQLHYERSYGSNIGSNDFESTVKGLPVSRAEASNVYRGKRKSKPIIAQANRHSEGLEKEKVVDIRKEVEKMNKRDWDKHEENKDKMRFRFQLNDEGDVIVKTIENAPAPLKTTNAVDIMPSDIHPYLRVPEIALKDIIAKVEQLKAKQEALENAQAARRN